jgi:glutathione peroxidase
MSSFHEFSLPAIDGKDRSLSDFQGKVCLVVNVASKCGLTPQYEGLQKLYDGYKDRGLEVLGFPCNQFLGQEPGTDEEIRTFCSTKFGVTFPLFSKIEVNGDGAHPLYAWLTGEPTEPEGSGDVKWNFGKFLIGKDGSVLARFEPPTDPADAAVTGAIEKALA